MLTHTCQYQGLEKPENCPVTESEPTASPTKTATKPTSEPEHDCQSRINHHRTKYGISNLVTERKDLHSCANRQSQYDKVNGSHSSFKICGFMGSQGSGGGSNCAEVIDMFFSGRWDCFTNRVVSATPIDEIVTGIGSKRDCQQACMDDSVCLSFGYDSKATLPCKFYAKASEGTSAGGSMEYCAAGDCSGHCGPVMDADTTTFAWGFYKDHYTLNWRPSVTLPAGGDACPSGIEVVKCWNDKVNGILWAYGVGGGTCHSTCSLAGATPASFMCDVNTPNDGGFDQVKKIMENFENPYNSGDTGEFTCEKGSCWGGETSRQILIHEANSNCYSSDSDQYTCDLEIGNANCFGERFNQVCPCILGCSSAAGYPCVSQLFMMTLEFFTNSIVYLTLFHVLTIFN